MKKILHIAKANLLRHKGAAVSLFVIIAIVSALATASISVLLEAEKDYWATIDRMNSMHSMITMPRDQYKLSYEEFVKNDRRVSQYEISEVLIAGNSTVDYGGTIELNIIIADIDEPIEISAPFVTERDESIPRESAVYLPILTKNYGYQIGDPFNIVSINREFNFIIAGFFETTELSLPNAVIIKVYVHNEGYEWLTRYLVRNILLEVRFHDADDSVQFNRDFNEITELEVTAFGSGTLIGDTNANELKGGALYPVNLVIAIILLFTAIIILILLLVIRFRVTNNIENTMHEIGVLKAQGYTSRQIVTSYIVEYGIVSIPAAALGAVAVTPLFRVIHELFGAMTGFPWTFGVNTAAGVLSVLAISAILLLMVLRSARRIKMLPPVTALRGGIATNNFRRNFFPLKKFVGGVNLGLGLKNMFAYFKFYAMIGIVIAGVSLAITFMAALYQNFVVDPTSIIRISGMEASDVTVTVTRHTDADALAEEMERMPEVRKTSMMDMMTLKIDDIDVFIVYISDDYLRYETFMATEGRFPVYDNEVALPVNLARELNKQIGDSVRVEVGGVSQDYIITGHYSTLMNNGIVAAITLEGYQRLNPNYRRNSINVYLNEGVTFDEFSEILKQRFGVLNVYHEEEAAEFAAAKARAEERISFYLEQYNIDSVEYAVIYNGEIILSGSSDAYQIERITDYGEWMKAALGTYASIIPAITQVIVAVSLVIVSLILIMTVRSIVAKRRRELGTLKATGFTTKQLTRQLAISFLPMTAIGVVIGCVGGAMAINPVMGGALAFAGAHNATFDINPFIVVILGVAILLVTYLMAHISAMQIRHISAYELLSE